MIFWTVKLNMHASTFPMQSGRYGNKFAIVIVRANIPGVSINLTLFSRVNSEWLMISIPIRVHNQWNDRIY